jgi:hypothetical protein
MAHDMTEAEAVLAANLLELASDKFSNHGCNDLELPNDDEHWAIVVAAHAWGGTRLVDMPDRPPNGRQIVTYDWLVMSYLAHRLAPEVE